MNIFKNIIITGADAKPMALDVFYKDTNSTRAVIYAHGFNGFKDWGNFDLIASQFMAEGFVFIKFNFSHNGTTPEEPETFADLSAFANNNYTKELTDLQSVINWTLDKTNPYLQQISIDKLFLIGHSMGGGIVLLKSAEEAHIKGVATWAAIGACKTPWGSWPNEKIEEWKTTGVQYIANSRTKQQMPLNYQLYRDYEENAERLDILKAVSKLTVPLLICHGSKDEAVPVHIAYQLEEAGNNATLFIVDSDHVFGRKHPWTQNVLPKEMQQVVDKTILFFKDIT